MERDYPRNGQRIIGGNEETGSATNDPTIDLKRWKTGDVKGVYFHHASTPALKKNYHGLYSLKRAPPPPPNQTWKRDKL